MLFERPSLAVAIACAAAAAAAGSCGSIVGLCLMAAGWLSAAIRAQQWSTSQPFSSSSSRQQGRAASASCVRVWQQTVWWSC